ncbi:MAG: M60 family metallopeptidase [Planctomycetota bacterium]|jgi:hypothetical protein
MRSATFLVFIATYFVATPELAAQQAGDHLEALRRGVEKLPKRGVPGPVAAFGPKTFVVCTGTNKQGRFPLAAAGTAGKGRLLVMGHGGYAGTTKSTNKADGDLRRLQENILRWLGHGAPRQVWFVGRGGDGLQQIAQQNNWKMRRGSRGFEDAGKGTVLVLLNSNIAATQVRPLQDAVRRGAGLCTFGPGWGWLQLNRGKTLAHDHRANQVLRPFGLAIGDTYLNKVEAVRPTEPAVLQTAHARDALARLLRGGQDKNKSKNKKQLAQATAVVEHALGALPLDRQIPFVGDVLARLSSQSSRGPTKGNPVRQAQPLRRIGVRLAQRQRRAQLPIQKKAPEADDFPGAVPDDARRLQDQVREIDLSIPGWHGTGLYAAAGETVTLTVPESATNLGLALRIGCHKDRLWHKPKWNRFPDITVQMPVRGRTTKLAGAFGGLVYVVVPGGRTGRLVARLDGAVLAPRFVLGNTEPGVWPEIRKRPGPWAELDSGKVVLTVPSATIRKLEDPVALLEHWNEALDCYAELGNRPLARRPQRIVADRQISAGYMHAGYPIMTHLDAAARMVDRKHLTTKGDWGLWHELGHNHQQRDWTFGGTGEVTCNLFTLFLMERFTGVAPKDNPRMTKQLAFVTRHVAAGAPFDQWKSKPFLALYMYMQLQREFGWEAFQKVFAVYRDLPASSRPKGDADKRDQWMVRFSRTVGHNLGPFFERWGVPTSAAARKSIVDLPAWMPAEFAGR